MYHLSCPNEKLQQEIVSLIFLPESEQIDYPLDFCLELLTLAHNFGSTKLKTIYIRLSYNHIEMSPWNALKLLDTGITIRDRWLTINSLRHIIKCSCIEKLVSNENPDAAKKRNNVRTVIQNLLSFILMNEQS